MQCISKYPCQFVWAAATNDVDRGLHNRDLSPTVKGLQVQDQVTGRFGVWCGPSSAEFAVSSHGGGARELSGIPFISALSPFMRPPPSCLIHLPKAPPPNTITLGGKVLTCEFGGNINVHTIATPNKFNI